MLLLRLSLVIQFRWIDICGRAFSVISPTLITFPSKPPAASCCNRRFYSLHSNTGTRTAPATTMTTNNNKNIRPKPNNHKWRCSVPYNYDRQLLVSNVSLFEWYVTFIPSPPRLSFFLSFYCWMPFFSVLLLLELLLLHRTSFTGWIAIYWTAFDEVIGDQKTNTFQSV